MADKKQIAKLVAENYSPVDISQKLGSSPSYIYNLLDDENFLDLVAIYKEDGAKDTTEKYRRHQTLDEGYDILEELAVERMLEVVGEGSFQVSLKDAMKVAEFANKQKRKTGPANESQVINNNTVAVINLPKHLMEEVKEVTSTEVTFNEKNQLIAVGGRALTNMSIEGINELSDSAKIPLIEE